MAQGYAGVPPGPLSAYLGVREANRAGGFQDLQGAGQVQGLLAKQQQMQEIAQLKSVVAEAAGNPAKAIENLIRVGSPMALKLASDMRGLMPKPEEPFTLSAGQQRFKPGVAAPYASVPAAPERPASIGAGGLRLPSGQIVPPQPNPNIQEPTPVQVTDAQGNVKLYDRRGNLIRDLGKVGKPNTEILKEQMARAKMNRDLSQIIPTLTEISQEGGLLDQATGSGAGALVDIASGFFGYGTPGAIAIGRLKPATDAVLKLVPRFEGPQSDKDTKIYQDAAGNLANPSTPNSVKKAAAKTILKIYKERQGQFVTRDYEAETGGSSVSAGGAPLGVDPKLWGVMTPEEKALWQK